LSRVGVIDCGTNSIRLLIADIHEGQFSEVLRRMEILSGVRDLLGIEPEVIAGEEEAKLSFLGATTEFSRSGAPFLVVDIGGGSTEFVYGSEVVEAAQSVNIGCVRMRERHLHSQPPTEVQLSAAIQDIQEAISDAGKNVPIKSAKTLIAVAGTATTVAAAALGLKEYDPRLIHLVRISTAKVHEVARMFSQMKREDIAALGYMHPGRVDVITAGSLILSQIMTATEAKELVVSESDILDGMAWSIA
jgi:exopolyphosphatase/guanosine-5'-triphosphate,3'-diphosphate pyrophosphatase